MEIAPQPVYNLKIHNDKNEAKKYNIKVKKVATIEKKSKKPKKRSLKVDDTSSQTSQTVVKKTRLSDESEKQVPTIKWDNVKKEWVLPNGYELTEDYRIPLDAKVMLGRDCSAFFNLKKGDQLTKNGKICISSLITKPFVVKQILQRDPVMPDFKNEYTIHLDKKPTITQSAIGDLFTGKLDKWDPFVCRVESRLFNKKTNRYMLKLFDGDAMYKVQIGSQLFELVKQKFVDKDDLIQVIDYVSTKVNARKRVVILYNIKKIIVNTK